MWDWAVPDPSKKGITEILVQAGDVQCGDHEIGYIIIRD